MNLAVEHIDESLQGLAQTVDSQTKTLDVQTKALDGQAKTLDSQAKALDTQKVTTISLRTVQSAIDNLAVTQAEELERLRGSIDKLDSGPGLGSSELVLRRIEKDVAELLGRGAEDAEPIAERLDAISEQVEGLRRRVALRGRAAAELDRATLDALADAVAARLRGESVPALPEAVGGTDRSGTWGDQMRNRLGHAEYRRGLPGPRD
ncbi:MAG: hypothetical protein ACRDYC_04000, partial [Acidimicrobiales bacterium]